MEKQQCAIAVPLLNSYAHQYLKLPQHQIAVAGGQDPDGKWILIVVRADMDTEPADTFDEAKALIDDLLQ